MNKAASFLLNGLKNKAVTTVLNPLNQIVDQNLTDVTTTIGSFIIRTVRGKFQRSISFTIGQQYADYWMEEALYGILYQYNNLKKGSKLELSNARGTGASSMYVRLDDGTHNLKYRKWNILLCIQTPSIASGMPGGRQPYRRVYTIITYDLSPEFIELFEQDMINHRNSLLKIRSDKKTVSVYSDGHEPDGYTYWDKIYDMRKRKLNTIYLPREQKKLLVDTINMWFASKNYYIEHGIPHNLTILLYGPPGTGKTSITKMIASEWNRNLYECTGGKNGSFIPQCIMNVGEDTNYPLYSISDIDKYPFLINEEDISMDGNSDNRKTDENMKYKQTFGSMINALDGVMSGEDRIIVMTTNHIEKFSDVILRPGRIDLKMEIGYVTPEVFRKYVFDFYGKELPEDIELAQNDLTVSTMQFEVVFQKMPYEEFVKLHVK